MSGIKRRYVSISLPWWRTERRKDAPSTDEPYALAHATTGGQRLFALNQAASACGLVAGQSVSDAKALEPGLRIDEAALDEDINALTGLARWCGRWSPLTAADPQAPGADGLLLDITGCAHLFHGEAEMLSDILRHLKILGHEGVIAAAPTIGLAWGLARFAAFDGPVRVDAVQPHLDNLPIAALRVGEAAATARRFGLRRVGDLKPHSSASLARRFGLDFIRRLDQAAGVAAEPFIALLPKTEHRAYLNFAEPLLVREGVIKASFETLARLCAGLEEASVGARRIILQLYRVDGRVVRFAIGLASATRDDRHIQRVLRERLERADIDAGFGFDRVELLAHPVERLDGAQDRFAGDADAADLSRLRDVLAARLGPDAVSFCAFDESHVPERASGWATSRAATCARNVLRPLLVLDRPETADVLAEVPDGPPRRFRWRKVSHLVAAAEGPERIAPEWWRPIADMEGTRDYFRIETEEGRRFWLFREGLLGLETEVPRWFIHGVS